MATASCPGKIYGYARVSTQKQSIERQVRNITKAYGDEVIIFKEYFTGTTANRREWKKLLKLVKPGDTIVFDSVSRMSRNAEEGFSDFQKLYNANISLVFLKEPHVNTEVYLQALRNQISLTGTMVDLILEGVNKYLMELAKQQIRLAYEQSEKEVLDLRQRTKEGIETARHRGKKPGRPGGKNYTTKKAMDSKREIARLSADFNGTLKDKDVIQYTRINPKTFYKYKKEMRLDIIRTQSERFDGSASDAALIEQLHLAPDTFLQYVEELSK